MARRKTQRRRGRKQASHTNFSRALLRLKKLKPSEQQQAMNMANASFIRQFCKLLRKLKHAKLSRKKKQTLQRYKKDLRQLTNAKTTLSKRRRILSQKGGGFIKSILSSIPVVKDVIYAIDTY